MLLLANSKNEAVKKDLCLAFAQGNNSAYPESCEQMVCFLSSQYAIKNNNNPNNNNWDKNGGKSKRVMTPNQKTKMIALRVLQERM